MPRTPKPSSVPFSNADAATDTPVRRVSAKAPSKAVARRAALEPDEILSPVRHLTEKQARALTEEIKTRTKDIKHRTIQLWHLVSQAHEGEAFRALGYTSWKEYASKELDMSESRSFQLLDQAKVMRELAAAGASLDDISPPTARIVQTIKGNLPAVRRRAAEALANGEDIAAAIRAYAKALEEDEKAPKPAPRKSAARMVSCPCCEGSGLLRASDANRVRKTLSA